MPPGSDISGIATFCPRADAERVDPTQVPLSDTETVLIGLAVSAVVLPMATWRLVEHFNTMAHEGMHGAVGALSGGTVRSITMNENAEGETLVAFSAGGIHFPYTFLGYLGPSAFGLGAARLIQFGHILVVLWLIMGLLALLLIKVRRSFGFLTVPLAGFLIFLVLKYTSQTAQVLVVYVITWFLLLSGVRAVVQDGVNAGDAGILSGGTSIPRLVWFGLWLAGSVAAVVIGARWMLHPAVHAPVH
jgi:Peptidase M50B-like